MTEDIESLGVCCHQHVFDTVVYHVSAHTSQSNHTNLHFCTSLHYYLRYVKVGAKTEKSSSQFGSRIIFSPT